MSNYRSGRPYEEESSQSSDEKMDTASESFRSQDTPNSTLSSDFEDKMEPNVLRLQDPGVLRLSAPEPNYNIQRELSDSFITKMSTLHLDSPKTQLQKDFEPTSLSIENRPKNLGISPPKFSTSLVLTTSHPLMSPPDYPDLIPKKDKEECLPSFEDKTSETNGFSMYSLNTNNSKNNLYFSENFTTAESQILNESNGEYIPPDVAKVEPRRRIIIPTFQNPFISKSPDSSYTTDDGTQQRGLGRGGDGDGDGYGDGDGDGQGDESAILKYIQERNRKLTSHSTPKVRRESEGSDRVAEWCESTQIRSAPTFELPIELSSSAILTNECDSPEPASSPTPRSRSLYEARVDPATGRAALRPTASRAHPPPAAPSALRRTIALPPEDEDSCSLDSLSVSMDSEDEPPELEPQPEEQPREDTSDEKRARATSPAPRACPAPPAPSSGGSSPIPEYSAAEERYNERSFVSVHTGPGGARALCDMKVIEPFKRVLSHGGYDAQGSAVIVFSACHLPDTRRPDYSYVMDNLFLYVTWTLERLIGREYVLVYLHGSAGPRRLPSPRWLLHCYRLIRRRLRKSLKHLYLVHPTFWLKSFVMLTKPFVSSKFFRKLSYVSSLDQLQQLVPVEPNAIPDIVRAYDQGR